MDASVPLRGWDIVLGIVILPLAIVDLASQWGSNRALAKRRREAEDRWRLQETNGPHALEAMSAADRRRVLRIRREREAWERRARKIPHAEPEAHRHG